MIDYFSDLGRALYWLSVDCDALDELLIPRQPSSGENAGKPASRAGSKPPLSVSILQLKADTEEVLGRWCGVLASAVVEVGQPPVGCEIARRAQWLSFHLEVMEPLPWFERAAEQIIAQGRLVADVVRPPESAGDPLPLEIGTAREIASWARNLGRQVSRSAIQRMIKDGSIPYQTAPDGRVLIRLADVLEQAPLRIPLLGPPKVVS